MIAIHQQEGIEFFEQLQPLLKAYTGLDSIRAPSLPVPEAAFDPLRNQYNAHLVAREVRTNGCSRYRLAIVDVDLYASGMNFIFGQADPVTRTAIISIHRLKGPRLNERLHKEAVHEMLHLMGMQHCSNPRCIMFFSNTVEDTDEKEIDLCNECRRQFETL